MELRSCWKRILTLMIAVVLAVTGFATPVFAAQFCNVRGGSLQSDGSYKVNVYSRPSFSSNRVGSVGNGAEIRVVRQAVSDGAGTQWAEYQSNNTLSGLAYIPQNNLANCGSSGGGGGTGSYDQGYQDGYRAGIEAAKRALEGL